MHMADEDMDPREFSALVHFLLLFGSITFVISIVGSRDSTVSIYFFLY